MLPVDGVRAVSIGRPPPDLHTFVRPHVAVLPQSAIREDLTEELQEEHFHRDRQSLRRRDASRGWRSSSRTSWNRSIERCVWTEPAAGWPKLHEKLKRGGPASTPKNPMPAPTCGSPFTLTGSGKIRRKVEKKWFKPFKSFNRSAPPCGSKPLADGPFESLPDSGDGSN